MLARCPRPLVEASGARIAPHSFPTRRSSDLCSAVWGETDTIAAFFLLASFLLLLTGRRTLPTGRRLRSCRSEEHTSELQSRLHLVCRLLLEKKKRHKAPSKATICTAHNT